MSALECANDKATQRQSVKTSLEFEIDGESLAICLGEGLVRPATDGKAKLITKANGKYSPANSTLTVPISSLPGNTKFEFWTAKAFGVHTHMTSRSFAAERLDGRTITINWPM